MLSIPSLPFPSLPELYEENIRNFVDDLKEFEKEMKGEMTVIISNKKTQEKNKLNESDKKKNSYYHRFR